MAATVQNIAWLVARQVLDDTSPEANNTSTDDDSDACETGNKYDGRIGVRVSAIFVILVGGFLGAWFPTFAARRQSINMPRTLFFFAKYFGSGVIIATAFIHLLAPANEALTNTCLPPIWQAYSWVEGIALMTVFALFFTELMTMRYAKFGHSHDFDIEDARKQNEQLDDELNDADPKLGSTSTSATRPHSHAPGDDHLGHSRSHIDNEEGHVDTNSFESYSAQLTAIFILEFGVIFHSIFIGLTLAVAGSEFTSLYIVLVFHQTFEGLGLGSRLASIAWPKSKRWTPYILASAYAISTPVSIAIGLGVRRSYPPEGTTTLIVNGIFDSISAGILIYTGLVELMAHEFLFSPYMSKAPIKNVLAAFFVMCLGAGLMALLGKWA